MRRVAWIVVACALCPVASVRSAYAQGRELEISPFAAGVYFLGDGLGRYALERSGSDALTVEDARFENSWAAGLGAGLRLNDLVSVEASLAWVPTWLTGTNLVEGTDVYAYMYGVTGIVRLPISGPIEPYWGMGVGAKTFDYSGSIRSRTAWATTFVAGMSLDVGDGESIRVQGRDLLSPFDSGVSGAQGGWENDLMISAGVSWRIPVGRRARPTGQRRGGLFPG